MDTKQQWSFTEKHRAAIPKWNARWIDLIRSTEPIDFERTAMAVRGMLTVANLNPNIPIIHVRSPMMAAIVGGCASVFWSHVIKHAVTATFAATSDATHAATFAATDAATYKATYKATDVATRAATFAATSEATRAATFAATSEATDAATAAAAYKATRAATFAATSEATDAATFAATDAATSAATYKATDVATRAATFAATMFIAALGVVANRLGVSQKSIKDKCVSAVRDWYRFYNGGSEWAAWCSYLSFVRDVVGWHHQSHAKYRHYEDAAVHGGPRYMHTNFVLLSDRAAVRKINAAGQLHCDNGPALLWNCGTERYYLGGILLDEQIVMRPSTQTIEQINKEANADIRSIRTQRFGWPRYLKESGARCLDERKNDIEGTLEALYESANGERRLVATCPTGRVVSMGVPREIATCEAAQNWLPPRKFRVLART